MTIPIWQIIFRDAGHKWFTGQLDVHWHNGNVRRAKIGNNEIKLTTAQRDYIKEWVLCKNSVFLCPLPGVIDYNAPRIIPLVFTHGVPVGNHALSTSEYSRLKEFNQLKPAA